MHGCDVLPRLPEEESKSLVSQSTTVVAREISIYPAKNKIVYTKTCACHEILSFVPKLTGWFLRNDFMALRGMTILRRYESFGDLRSGPTIKPVPIRHNERGVIIHKK
jgi:hypothetical protein